MLVFEKTQLKKYPLCICPNCESQGDRKQAAKDQNITFITTKLLGQVDLSQLAKHNLIVFYRELGGLAAHFLAALSSFRSSLLGSALIKCVILRKGIKHRFSLGRWSPKRKEKERNWAELNWTPLFTNPRIYSSSPGRWMSSSLARDTPPCLSVSRNDQLERRTWGFGREEKEHSSQVG